MQLPLFPLNTVLFPGCMLNLQLFEPRYLDMLSRCMKQNNSFGIVTLIEGREVGTAAKRFSVVGCEALIKDWQQLANGLLGIRIEGGRRFVVEQADVQNDQLTVAQVQWIEPCSEQPLNEDHADLLALLQALAAHPMAANLGVDGLAGSQQALANQLAYLLPLGLEEKLALLELNQPAEQLSHIQVLLKQLEGVIHA